MLRQRAVVLRVVALRSITSQNVVPGDSAGHRDAPSSTAHGTIASRGDGQRDVSEAAAPHRSPAPTSSARKVYSKEGYSFITSLRTSGPGAVLGRVRWTLTVYALLGSAALIYVVHYLTTYTYVLTTNPAPFSNSLYQRFPCDLAIIENRLTLRRHMVEVTPATTPLLVDDAALDDAARQSASADKRGVERENAVGTRRVVRQAPAVVERQLRVNALLYRVHLYLQKSNSLVLVNAQAELNPQRFMNSANSVGREARAPVGFLREDQLLPDLAGNGNGGSLRLPRKRWWRWGGSSESAPSASCSPSSADTVAATVGPHQMCIQSEVRLRDAMNGYQKGHLYTYEQTITHLVEEKLAQRFYRYILERGMSEHKGLRKVYAEELIRNGLLSGTGVTLTQVVPDVLQFADELLRDLKEKLGDDVIVYRYSVKLQ